MRIARLDGCHLEPAGRNGRWSLRARCRAGGDDDSQDAQAGEDPLHVLRVLCKCHLVALSSRCAVRQYIREAKWGNRAHYRKSPNEGEFFLDERDEYNPKLLSSHSRNAQIHGAAGGANPGGYEMKSNFCFATQEIKRLG